MTKRKWSGEEYLVCTRCGRRQTDTGIVLMYKRRYPGVPSNGIPYVCGDCGGFDE